MDKESASQNVKVMDRLLAMNESAELGGGKAKDRCSTQEREEDCQGTD